jgi:hypothetical protein
MVDDHTHRPYRSSETIARSAPAKAPSAPSGNDPLAELARLIGQSDPFSEFGRDGTRRVAAPQDVPEEPVQQSAGDWDNDPATASFVPPPIAPDARSDGPMAGRHDYFDPTLAQPANFGRQSFGSAPLAVGDDLYRVEGDDAGYPAHGTGAYGDGRYAQEGDPLAEHDDYYDDEPSSGRRMGIMVIAGIFALAVIGTAGAFGYRAMFGSSASLRPPPVIKADATPVKIVPDATQSGKQINDRVNDSGIGEKLVSREEQPVQVTSPPDANQSAQPQLGSGVIGTEAKKVRTIAIRPDQPAGADNTPAAAPQAPVPKAAAPAKLAAPSQPPRVVATAPPAAPAPTDNAEPPPARAPAVRSTPPVQQQAAAPAAANAPLSLSPDAAPARPAPVRAAAAPVRTAAVAAAPAAAPASSSGSYAVQVSSQRSEAEAQAAFRSLQGKYPSQLGGKQVVVRQVDLGDKGVYYRAMIPSASGGEATELCTSLKAAGGSCIIQRN